MWRILFRFETIVYATLAFFLLVFFFFMSQGAYEVDTDVAKYYARAIGDSTRWAIVLVLIAGFIGLGTFLMRSFFGKVPPTLLFSKERFLRVFRSSISVGRNCVVVGIPFVLMMYTLSLALGQLNQFNSTRLQDELLLKADMLFTHTFPAFALGSLHYPAWFLKGVEFCFLYLIGVLIVFGVYLFFSQQKLFREATAAFSLGLVTMFLGWLLVPALSPHDRFLDNVYNLPVSASAKTFIDGYHPQPPIEKFLERMRENKERHNVLPTTTFPSGHAAWGVFLVYYSYRVRKWLLVFALPFVVLSTIGTNLFAQHYFVDIPAGIGVVILSVWVARFLARKQTA